MKADIQKYLDTQKADIDRTKSEKAIFENHCHCFAHGGYGNTQVPVPQTERWIVHKENEDSNDKK